MKSEEDKIIRSDPEGGSVQVVVESEGFVPGYQPESMTKITVPDLPDDALGISAEALAKVPTLTEQVTPNAPEEVSAPEPKAPPAAESAPEREPEPEAAPALTSEPPATADADAHPAHEAMSAQDVHSVPVPQDETVAPALEAQDTVSAAESWVEQCQVRIDQLSDDIQKLNDRLDQLEQTKKV